MIFISVLGTYQFCIVQRHNHTEVTHAQTRNEPPSVDVVRVLGTCLDNDADAKHNHRNDNRDATTGSIGQISVDEGSEPGTEFQNRGQHALFHPGRLCISLGLEM